MPELAEVEYYRKQWAPALGKTVCRVLLHGEKRIFRGVDCAAFQADLPGRSFDEALSHGKQLCFRFGGQIWLGVHLGMTGKLSFSKGEGLPQKHDHLVLEMESGGSLIFSDPRLFGRVLYEKTEGTPRWWAERPPSIISAEFTPERMLSFLQRRSGSPIKAVLLMQEMFPGVGNWMADEILWRARIHPATTAGRLSPLKRSVLYERLREVCGDALAVIGVDWGRPPDDWLFNHRWKKGGYCPKTGGLLSRETIAGRTTCWSPKWQRKL